MQSDVEADYGQDVIKYLGVEKPWPWQTRALEEAIEACKKREKVVITAPTGAGKSIIFIGLIRWALDHGLKIGVYCCRNLLLQQLKAGLERAGVDFGIMAAQYRKEKRMSAKAQLCSLDTVYAAVQRKDFENVAKFDIVVIDEAHQQKQEKAQKIFNLHTSHGAALIGFTATPVELAHIYDRCFVAAHTSELRAPELDFPAHLACTVYGCPELDTEGLKPLKTGEYSNRQVVKEVWTPQIFGHIEEHWRRLNPQQKPTLLFAPGVKESMWICDQLNYSGIPAAHIDGETVYVDGKEYQSDPRKREEVIQRLEAGEIKIICNRFVMREGIDIPSLFSIILATPIGNLSSYVQVVGRVLRNHDSLDHVIIQDHAGNFWRHGSPMEDRAWEEYFQMTHAQSSEIRRKKIEKGEVQNPIVCPKCNLVRRSGSKCPKCGFSHTNNRRMVIQQNGELRALAGPPITKINTKVKSDTEAQWVRCFYRCRNSKRTVNQAYALFVYEQGYHPPKTLKYMPKDDIDWYERIHRIPLEKLRKFSSAR